MAKKKAGSKQKQAASRVILNEAQAVTAAATVTNSEKLFAAMAALNEYGKIHDAKASVQAQILGEERTNLFNAYMKNMTSGEVNSLTYRHAQQICKYAGLAANGSTLLLKERLLDYIFAKTENKEDKVRSSFVCFVWGD